MSKPTEKIFRQYSNALLKACEELSKSNRACMTCSVCDTCSRRQSEATQCTLHIMNKFLNEGAQNGDKTNR